MAKNACCSVVADRANRPRLTGAQITASKGYRRPHKNTVFPSATDPNDPFVPPEVAEADTLWNYELGAKARWFGGRLQANLAAYFIEWDDMQIIAIRPSDGSGFLTNIGDAESTGIEAELLVLPTDRLALGLNLTFQDAEIVSLNQVNAIAIGGAEGAKLSSPDSQISGFAHYVWAMKNGGELYARIDYQYVEGFPNGMPNVPGSDPQEPNPFFAYTDSIVNVNLQFGWENSDVSVVLYSDNVLDNHDHGQINIDSFTAHRYGTLRPRTIGLRVNWRH